MKRRNYVFIADVYGKSTIDKLSKKQKETTADELIHYLCTNKQKFGIDEKSMDKSMVLKLINIRYQIWLNKLSEIHFNYNCRRCQ